MKTLLVPPGPATRGTGGRRDLEDLSRARHGDILASTSRGPHGCTKEVVGHYPQGLIGFSGYPEAGGTVQDKAAGLAVTCWHPLTQAIRPLTGDSASRRKASGDPSAGSDNTLGTTQR